MFFREHAIGNEWKDIPTLDAHLFEPETSDFECHLTGELLDSIDVDERNVEC